MCSDGHWQNSLGKMIPFEVSHVNRQGTSLPGSSKENDYCESIFSFGVDRNTNESFLTSVFLSCKIVSVWVRDEVFRACFFCSIAELTHVTRQHKIKALTSIISLTSHQAPETEIRRHCLVNMSL